MIKYPNLILLKQTDTLLSLGMESYYHSDLYIDWFAKSRVMSYMNIRLSGIYYGHVYETAMTDECLKGIKIRRR